MLNKRTIILLSTVVSLWANPKICYNLPKDTKITNVDIEVFKKSAQSPIFTSDNVVERELLKNRLFAKSFLEKNNLKDNDVKRYVNLMVEQALASLYIAKIKEKNKPSDSVIKSFYLDHIDSIKPVEQVSVSVIALDSLKRADEVYLELKKDSSKFEAIAKKESLDPSASDGGHYKDIKITNFAPVIRKYLREHKVAQVSQPMQVGRFFYIERIDKKEKSDVGYDSLKKDVKDLLSNIYLNQKIKEEFEKLKSKEGLKWFLS